MFESVIGAFLHRLFRDKLYYWRDGNEEVDFVVDHDGEVFGIEVKSSRTRRKGGATAFVERFRDARSVIINEDSGMQLLLMNSRDEMLGFLRGLA